MISASLGSCRWARASCDLIVDNDVRIASVLPGVMGAPVFGSIALSVGGAPFLTKMDLPVHFILVLARDQCLSSHACALVLVVVSVDLMFVVRVGFNASRGGPL